MASSAIHEAMTSLTLDGRGEARGVYNTCNELLELEAAIRKFHAAIKETK